MKRTLWSAGTALAALLLSSVAGAAPILSTEIICPQLSPFPNVPIPRGVAKLSKGGDLSFDMKSGFLPNQTITCLFTCYAGNAPVLNQPNCGTSDATGRVRIRLRKAVNLQLLCPNPSMTFQAFGPQFPVFCTPGFGGQ